MPMKQKRLPQYIFAKTRDEKSNTSRDDLKVKKSRLTPTLMEVDENGKKN